MANSRLLPKRHLSQLGLPAPLLNTHLYGAVPCEPPRPELSGRLRLQLRQVASARNPPATIPFLPLALVYCPSPSSRSPCQEQACAQHPTIRLAACPEAHSEQPADVTFPLHTARLLGLCPSNCKCKMIIGPLLSTCQPSHDPVLQSCT